VDRSAQRRVDRRSSARRALVAAAAFAAAGGVLLASGFNGPGAPIPNANLGSLAATASGGCAVEFAATVHTASGGGQDDFSIQISDDGRLIRVVDLYAPADGTSHVVNGAFELTSPPGDATPGIGLYLVDDGRILDAIDPFVVPCGALAVPALGGRGLAALVSLLAFAALATLGRARRA
jgi:hypothetical protein